MGMWGSGIFEDDLALDIKGSFDRAVKEGKDPREAARGLMQTDLAKEILEEVVEDEWDDGFWEESGGLFFAVATLQLQHGVVTADVKRQTLLAIDAWNRLAEGDAERLAVLAKLRAELEG